MKPTQAAKNAARFAMDPFETLTTQAAKPIFDEAISELGSFFGAPRLGRNPKTMGQEELKRARDEKKIKEMGNQDEQDSKEKAQKLTTNIQMVQKEYTTYQTKTDKDQQPIRQEFDQLQTEIAKLAKAAGVDTKAHLEQTPQKVGVLDIKRLVAIVRTLRMKAEDAKSGSELVNQRANAKRTTGMLAWVSGKQMKVHEQGTLQLQG